MSEERMKVLELLSEGKISVEEADRLLRALGESPASEGKGRRRNWNVGGELDDIEGQIRERVDQARETIRTSLPNIKQTVQEAIPDIDRIVREATADLPKALNEMTRTLSETFAGWKDMGDEHRFPEKAERHESLIEALAAGSRFVLHNPRGSVKIETWDREEVSVNAKINARGRSAEEVQRFIEAISLGLERKPEALYVNIGVPPRDDFAGVGRWQLDFVVNLPQKLDLELRTQHGSMEVPHIDGNLVIGTRHGKSQLGGASGNVSVQQAHGNLEIGPVGQALVLDSRHGQAQLATVGGSATVKNAHGNLEIGRVEGALEIESAHGNLGLAQVGGSARLQQRHGAINLESTGGDLTVDARHAPLHVGPIGGKGQIVNHHGPIDIAEITEGLVASNHHGSIQIRSVGANAVVKNHHASIRLAQVGGDATAENSHGSIDIDGVKGRTAARNSHGSILLENVEGEVVAQTQRSNIRVRPQHPVQHPYTLQARHGNIEVEIPAGSDLEVQANAGQGRIQTDLPLEVVANSHRGQMASGNLGAGGTALKVETERGNISLKGA